MLESAFFRLIAVAVLILATAFFVAAEFAIISVRETRLEQLLKQGVSAENMQIVSVPGALEAPLILQKLAQSGRWSLTV